MDGKVVQLRQGREKVLEGKSPDEMLAMFAGFPEIQVIDLDAAMGRGFNTAIVEHLAARTQIRAGGGVRTPERAAELVAQGAHSVIVGTAAFGPDGPDTALLGRLVEAVSAARLMLALDSKGGKIVVKGWQEATRWTACEVLADLEPYCSAFLCTYVDKEGMMQGTDLDWFRSLRSATQHNITAAGGITTIEDVRALTEMQIDCAIGMSIYTGRLSLAELRAFNASPLRE
jgi:phosphoribosylformimino-5-aminoimidazole carboxamide ribonucleotide (ProFAR) isomerase